MLVPLHVAPARSGEQRGTNSRSHKRETISFARTRGPKSVSLKCRKSVTIKIQKLTLNFSLGNYPFALFRRTQWPAFCRSSVSVRCAAGHYVGHFERYAFLCISIGCVFCCVFDWAFCWVFCSTESVLCCVFCCSPCVLYSLLSTGYTVLSLPARWPRSIDGLL